MVVSEPMALMTLASCDLAALECHGRARACALALYASEVMRSCVHAPFHRCSRWGWWRRPCWRARHSSPSCGRITGCWSSAELSVSRMICRMVCRRSVSRGSCTAGHGLRRSSGGRSPLPCRGGSVRFWLCLGGLWCTVSTGSRLHFIQ